MRKILFFLTVVLVACTQEITTNSISNVVPYPNEVQMGEGEFNAKGAAVTYDAALDEAIVNLINAFASKLSTISGTESEVSAGTAEQGFVFVNNPEIAEEAYVLDVKPEVVRVEASALRGFNYAIQTIKQLLPVEIFAAKPAPRASWTIQCVTISDAPRYSYRGLHLDEGRHFFGVEAVKRYLDIMEVHKLNKFHWHLTEDQGWRIEIKKYPLLTEVGAVRKGTCIKKDFSSHDGVPYGEGMWYTQDQIREIVAYAAAKGIDVIPEIDLPGHMLGALAAYPELGCTGGPYEVWTRWGVSDDVLCAGNEAIYGFLEDILTEVCELFPYEYIHIGGDECPKVRWETCPKCQAKIKELKLKDKDGEKAEHFLQSYVISRMEKFLNEKGRKIIGWDEILEGGIAPNATIMSWRGEKGGIEAARQGHDAIMTPNTYYYLDYYQSEDIANEPFGIGGYLPVEKCYSYEPAENDLTPEQKKHILGIQGNMWTEYVATEDHLQYMILPRLAALSECQWCNVETKSWNRFSAAAVRFCKMYDVMGYNYATHMFQVKGDVVANPAEKSVTVTLETQGDAPIRYTLDGSKPGKKSPVYTEPLVLNESCVLTAVAFRDNVEPKYYTRRFDFHKAVGKNVTFSREVNTRYAQGGAVNLTDGVRATEVHKSIDWVSWRGDAVDLVVDMESTEPYSSVSFGMLSHKASRIFLPVKLAIAVSEDGVNYTEVASQEYEEESKDAPDDKITEYSFSFPETSARYIKVTGTPVDVLPEWHYNAGARVYIYFDEIIVR